MCGNERRDSLRKDTLDEQSRIPPVPAGSVKGAPMSPTGKSKPTAAGIVALFNASDDTVDMVQALLTAAGDAQSLVWCHFTDLKKGIVDFAAFIEQHNPEVVVFDISPPYDANWHFFKTMRDSTLMKDRGMILTTTNKNRLDEVAGADSRALEVVGKAKDLQEIDAAIKAGSRKARAVRLATA
jgi:DNA-binding response OmpR family regulator